MQSPPQPINTPYGVLPNQSVPQSPNVSIINNQINPNNSLEMLMLPTILKSEPRFIACPYCKSTGITRTEKKISFKSTLLFLCSPLIWGAFQMCREKDLNCYDADHYCIYCNSKLNSYTSC